MAALQEFDRVRIDSTGRMTPRAVRTEAACTERVQDGFGHDAAHRVAGADEQDVVGGFQHGSLSVWMFRDSRYK